MFFKRRVYLDVAAAHPVRGEAARTFARAAQKFANPSSSHDEGIAAKEVLEEARKSIARLTEVKPDDIIFTSGATEANALAILGVARSQKENPHFLYLPSAHASVVENMRLRKEWGAFVETLPIHEGEVDIAALRTLLRPETALVSMDAVCGETGTVWNTRDVAEILRKSGSRALLHVDASQAPLTEKISRAHFSADLMTLDAGKVGGLRGAGCLIAHRTIQLFPLYRGGGQERDLRPGTENGALLAAFAAALSAVVNEREMFRKRAKALRAKLLAGIEARVRRVEVVGGKEVAPHIINLSLPGRDTDYLVALLNEAGYAVSTRSACETDSVEGSRAVYALTGDAEKAKSTLRISFGHGTRSGDLARFVRTLLQAVQFVDKPIGK